MRFYRPELDLLRLLALLMVFVRHATPSAYIQTYPILQTVADACGSGLQLFFLLSAFLIAELLLREKESTGTIHLKAFYMRRILRIWPLYFLVICVAALFGRWTHFTPHYFLAYALLAGNWMTYMHGFVITPVMPLWSISIEEQFYLIWPSLSRFGGRSTLLLSSIFFIALANLTLFLLGSMHAPANKPWTHTLVEFQFFAAGTILALWLHRRPAFRIWDISRVPILVAGAFLAYSYTHLSESGNGLGLIAAYALLTASVVCIFAAFYGMRVPSICSPLLYLGKISYGLYVFHFFGFLAVKHLFERMRLNAPFSQTVVTLLLTIALASLSYRYVEMPFLNLKKRFTFISSRPQ